MKEFKGSITHLHRGPGEFGAKPLSFGLIVRLFRHMGAQGLKRNALLALVVIRSIQLPSLAWLIGIIIAGPVARMDTRGIGVGALGYLVLAVITQVTLRYRARFGLELGEFVVSDLRKKMFGNLQRLQMSFFSGTRVGRIISRFTSDTEAVRVGIKNVFFVTMVLGGQMLVAAALMIWYDWVLFLVIGGMVPGLWALNRYFRRRLSEAHRAVQESFSRVTATLAESVSGVRVTQGFSRESVNADLFHELVTDHSRYNVDAARSAGIFVPMLEFNTQLFVAMVLLVGGWRVLTGRTDIGTLYQFVLMANIFFSPIQSLGRIYTEALAAMAGAERVFAVMDEKPDWTDPADAERLCEAEGKIEFEEVSFAYQEGRTVVHDVTVSVEPGQTIALVGPTGSGKSTLINLIAKFYLPTSGTLKIDGCDTRSLDTDSLHKQMGIVLQQNFLFTGTVLDNIRIGKPDATRQDVVEAASKLNCLDLIASLPDGFATVVGEGGTGISMGQRQLICFTRAMLANPRLLLLDEATSSVDTLTEARIQKALSNLLKGRTSIVAAHRLSTVTHADLVLVMAGGRIVERGTHHELLSHGGLYADLYRQFIQSSSDPNDTA